MQRYLINSNVSIMSQTGTVLSDPNNPGGYIIGTATPDHAGGPGSVAAAPAVVTVTGGSAQKLLGVLNTGDLTITVSSSGVTTNVPGSVLAAITGTNITAAISGTSAATGVTASLLTGNKIFLAGTSTFGLAANATATAMSGLSPQTVSTAIYVAGNTAVQAVATKNGAGIGGVLTAGDLLINGTGITPTTSLGANNGVQIVNVINTLTGTTGVTATLVTPTTTTGQILLTSPSAITVTFASSTAIAYVPALTGLTSNASALRYCTTGANVQNPAAVGTGVLATGDILINTTPISGVTLASTSGTQIVDAINGVQTTTGVVASLTAGPKITLTSVNQTPISVAFSSTNATAAAAYSGLAAGLTTNTVYDDDLVSGAAQDANVRTLTFRDAFLSPIGKATSDLTGIATAGQTLGTSAVTLFASDGTTYSMKSFLVWTKFGSSGSSYGGLNYASPAWTGQQGVNGKPVSTTGGIYTYIPSRDGKAWTTSTVGAPGLLFPAASSDSTNGLCLVTSSGQGGSTYGIYSSPNNYFSLTANMVYRIRLNIANKSTEATALTAGNVPFWDVMVDNQAPDNSMDGKYLQDFYNLDHNGENNDLVNRHQFDVWFTPPQVNSASWNTGGAYVATTNGKFYQSDIQTSQTLILANPTSNGGAYTYTDPGEFSSSGPNHAANNGFRLRFRIMDITNGAKSASSDYGNLCLNSYSVTGVPISLLTGGTMWSAAPVTNSVFVVHSALGPSQTATTTQNGSTAVTQYAFSSTGITLRPNLQTTNSFELGKNAWDLEVASVYPGWTLDGVTYHDGDSDGLFLSAGHDPEVVQAWPIPWGSNQLLKGTVTIAAPTSAAAFFPADVLMLSWDSPTYEIFQDSMAVYGLRTNPTGMPAFGTNTDYVSFLWTHTKSSYVSMPLSNNGGIDGKQNDAQRLRLRLSVINSPNLLSGGSAHNDLSQVLVKNVKIELVNTPLNMP
jgi:hypothetical protein